MMLFTTTDTLQGKKIVEYLGIITCSGFDKLDDVYEEFENSAKNDGANAVIGVRINPYPIVWGGQSIGTDLRFVVSGTKVVVEDL